MPTPKIQKGHYNDADDEENLQQGEVGDGENKTVSPVVPTGTDAQPQGQGNGDGAPSTTYGGYDDIINLMQSAAASSQKDIEQAKRQERLARTHSFTSGLGDLGRAISNLFFTTQYAPNGYDHSKDSLSEKSRERADKWRAERQRLQKEYYNYSLQGANAKTARERLRNEQEKTKMAQDKLAREEERKDALNKAKVESYNAKTKYCEAIANKNDALAKKYEEDVLFLQAKQKYLELGYNLKQAESQARIDADEALAEKRRAEAGGTTTNTTIERDRQGNETGRTVTRTPNGKGQGYGSSQSIEKGRGY